MINVTIAHFAETGIYRCILSQDGLNVGRGFGLSPKAAMYHAAFRSNGKVAPNLVAVYPRTAPLPCPVAHFTL